MRKVTFEMRQLVFIVARLINTSQLRWCCLSLMGYSLLSASVSILLNVFGGGMFKFTAIAWILLFLPLGSAIAVWVISALAMIWAEHCYEDRFGLQACAFDNTKIMAKLANLAVVARHTAKRSPKRRESELEFQDAVTVVNTVHAWIKYSRRIAYYLKYANYGIV